MPERRYTILSTAALPFNRMAPVPDSVRVVVVPFIQIIPRSGIEIKPLITEYASRKKTVVFTSAHAVKIVSDCLQHIPEWKIYCTRNETRAAVEKYFGQESIANYSENALALSKCLIADRVHEVLFFCGDQRLNILPDQAKKHNIEFCECVIYDTRLTPVVLEEQPDALLFFSPTAVRSFFSVNRVESETRVFAMGATTAQALKEFMTRPPIISTESDKAFVLNMAIEYATSHSIT